MLDDARLLAQAKKQPEPEEEKEAEEQAVEDTAYFQMRQRIMELMSVLDETDAKLISLRFGLEGGMPLSPRGNGKAPEPDPRRGGRKRSKRPEQAALREIEGRKSIWQNQFPSPLTALPGRESPPSPEDLQKSWAFTTWTPGRFTAPWPISFDLWGVSPKDIDGITRYIDELTIGIEYDDEGVQHMIMNGMDVTGDIRTPRPFPEGQSRFCPRHRPGPAAGHAAEMAEKHNVIMDGRDIGTVVLPKATVKIFLTATPEVRAKAPHGRADREGTEGGLQ